MRPTMQLFTLIKKKNLTEDVYELIFEGEQDIPVKPGQFITFMLEKFGARSYSVLEKSEKIYSFIIKKIALEEGGRGGSEYICDLEIGATLKGIGASGIFILQKNNKNKLFLGTGTGFVPLYFQIKSGLENNIGGNYHFIFGVRYKKDLFYEQELKNLQKKYPHFSYTLFLSREEHQEHKKGYIIEEIKEAYHNYDEAYICGSPTMVEYTKKELLKYNFPEKDIFEEKY